MKGTWGNVDTSETSLQESEHRTKERVEYKDTHQNRQASERTQATPIM